MLVLPFPICYNYYQLRVFVPQDGSLQKPASRKSILEGENTMKGNIVVGQSGGPTAVINSSVAGVYAAAKKLGALHGLPPEPKSGASANSAISAYSIFHSGYR